MSIRPRCGRRVPFSDGVSVTKDLKQKKTTFKAATIITKNISKGGDADEYFHYCQKGSICASGRGILRPSGEPLRDVPVSFS